MILDPKKTAVPCEGVPYTLNGDGLTRSGSTSLIIGDTVFAPLTGVM